jgi:hypothetical protein
VCFGVVLGSTVRGLCRVLTVAAILLGLGTTSSVFVLCFVRRRQFSLLVTEVLTFWILIRGECRGGKIPPSAARCKYIVKKNYIL